MNDIISRLSCRRGPHGLPFAPRAGVEPAKGLTQSSTGRLLHLDHLVVPRKVPVFPGCQINKIKGVYRKLTFFYKPNYEDISNPLNYGGICTHGPSFEALIKVCKLLINYLELDSGSKTAGLALSWVAPNWNGRGIQTPILRGSLLGFIPLTTMPFC